MGYAMGRTPHPREERFMKHTFVAADGEEKTIKIPDEVLLQARKEGLNVKQAIERFLSDEGYIVDPTVAELTAKAKANKINGAGRQTQEGQKKKRKAPTRKPDQTKRDLINELNNFLSSLGHNENSLNMIHDIEVTNIERVIAFSIGEDKYELTLSKKRKPKN